MFTDELLRRTVLKERKKQVHHFSHVKVIHCLKKVKWRYITYRLDEECHDYIHNIKVP